MGGMDRRDCVIAWKWEVCGLSGRKLVSKKNMFYLRLDAYVIDPTPIYVDLASPPQPSARLFLFSPLLRISFLGEIPQG